MSISYRLLDGLDRRDAESLEVRDAELLAAEHADLYSEPRIAGYAERVYVPTDRARDLYAQARRQERRDRVFLACIVAITTSWVALMTIAACAVLRGMNP